MIVIVCVDDNQGMLFNKRRQSQDRKILDDIWKMADRMWIHSFSEHLFVGYQERIQIDDDFLFKADEKEYCFVENMKLAPHEDKIEQLIMYKWNRRYPADFKLDVNLQNWKLESQEEFAGTSHEKITRETYVRG